MYTILCRKCGNLFSSTKVRKRFCRLCLKAKKMNEERKRDLTNALKEIIEEFWIIGSSSLAIEAIRTRARMKRFNMTREEVINEVMSNSLQM